MQAVSDSFAAHASLLTSPQQLVRGRHRRMCLHRADRMSPETRDFRSVVDLLAAFNTFVAERDGKSKSASAKFEAAGSCSIA